jgi:ATP-dependent DNA helicase RecG
MANAQGGLVIIGVEDNSLRAVGIQDVRVAVDVVLRAARMIQPVLVLDPPEPEIYTLDGKSLLVVGVPPNQGPLYQSSGVCWVRRGTYTVPLSVSEVLEVANDRGLVSWELQPARKATMQDIDLERVKLYLDQRSTRNRHGSQFEDLESVLIGMDCATVVNGSKVLPTNVGMLFFGSNPQWFLPQSEVVCVLYRDELGVGGYLDRKIVTGTLQELIDESEAFLNRYVAVGAKIERWKRVDLPEYPIEALREAIVNAVVHRDYSRTGESVRVFYYSDRIEIHSPGLLLPGITVEQMARGEVISKLRNPILANLLRDVPGYMERIGSGIRLMLYEMRKMGLSDPQFKETGEFVVIFRKAPVEPAKDERQAIDSGTQLGVGISGLPDQNSKFELAMRYVHEHGSITNREYRELTGVSDRSALRDLEILVGRGVLQAVGKRRGRYYEIP